MGSIDARGIGCQVGTTYWVSERRMMMIMITISLIKLPNFFLIFLPVPSLFLEERVIEKLLLFWSLSEQWYESGFCFIYGLGCHCKFTK